MIKKILIIFTVVFSFGFVVNEVVQMPDTKNGLISLWHCNEALWNGTAGEVKDSKSAKNGVRGGAATTASGYFGNSGTFDGTNDWVVVGDDAVWALGATFTITLWLKSDVTNTSTYFMSQYVNGANYFVPQFYGSNTPPNPMCLGWGANGANYDNVTVVTITSGLWYFLVWSVSSNQCTTYKNGVATGAAFAIPTVANYAIDLYIGSLTTGGVGYNEVDGLLDDVTIFNRALSAGEIQLLYYQQVDNHK